MRANKPKRKNRQSNFQDKDTVQTNRPVLKLTDDLRTKWHVSGRTSVNVTTTPDRKSTRLNSSHRSLSRMPSSA